MNYDECNLPEERTTWITIGARFLLIVSLFSSLLCLISTGSLNAQQTTTFSLTNIDTSGTGSFTSGGSGAYTLNGGGNGIGALTDSISFLKIETSGNVELITKIISQQSTPKNAIAGLMVRNTLDNESPFAMVSLSPCEGLNFFCRQQTGVPSRRTVGPSPVSQPWLKIVKSGNTISGFTSPNGYSAWTLVGETTISTPNTFFIGFVAASSTVPTLSTVQYSNGVFIGNVPQRSSDMLLWLRGDVGITESGGTITQWEDQSGFGNNAVQATIANQPKIQTAAINGLAAVNLAKVTTNRWMQVPSGFNDFSNGLSVFVVAEAPATATDARILDFGNNTSSNNMQVYQPANSTISFRAYNGSNGKATAAAAFSGGFKMASIVHDGNYKATVFVNGTEVSSAAGPSNMNNFVNIERTGNFLGKAFGAANYWEGKIAEVLIIKRALSTTERKSIESYFFYKYGSAVGTTPKPVPPTLSVPTGVYSSSQSMAMTPPALFTQIRYTTDGTDPTTSSTLYTSPLTVSTSTLFKAVTVAGGQISDISVAVIDIDSNSADVTRLGQKLWLKAGIGPNVVSGGVRTWYDLSGNNFDATQETSGSRPTVTSATVGSGSKPVVSFSGTQWLQLPKGINTGLSAFVVAKPTAGGGARFFDLSDQDTNNIQLMINGSATPDLRYRVYSPTQTTLDADDAVSFSTHKLYEVVQNGSTTNASIYINGTPTATSSTFNTISNVARSSNFLGKQFGNSNHFQGQIAEIVLYDRALTLSERLGMEAYFFAKYGAPVSAKPMLPKPIIDPPTTTVSGPIPFPVRITATNGAEIRYTDDGSAPNASSPLYPPSGQQSIELTSSKTIRAIALKPNFTTSDDESSTIVVDPESTGIVNENLIVWLNGETLGASASPISEWLDSSGNNNHASQIILTERPLVERPALNGLPAAKFDGSDDSLKFPDGFKDFTQGMTVFAVAKTTSDTPNNGRIVDFGNGATSDNVQLYVQNSPNFRFSVLNGATATNVTGNGITTNTFQLIEARHNGAGTARVLVNGSEKSSNSSMNNIANVSRNGNFLGKGYTASFFPGQIAELLIYDRSLSATTCKTIEDYLIAKYALVQTTPPMISPTPGVYAAPLKVSLTTTAPGATLYVSDDGTDPTDVYSGPFDIFSSKTIKAAAFLNGSTSVPPASSFLKIDDNTKFLPRDKMSMWLRADYGVDTSSPVAYWPDMSGQGNHATQTTGANKPTYVTSDGFPSINFSGSQWLNLPSNFSDFSDGLSMYVVLKPSSVDANDRILDLGTGSSANNIRLTLDSTTASKFWTSGSAGDSLAGPDSVSTSAYKVLEVIHTGRKAATILSDGNISQALTALANPTTVERTANCIGRASGGGSEFAGRIAEIILYKKALSKDEQLQVEAYLVGRYSLASGKVIAPTINPSAGVYSTRPEISMTAFPGAQIKYTLNGTDPASGTVYSAPFTLEQSAVIKAIATMGGVNSEVTTRNLQIDPNATAVSRIGMQLWYKTDFGIISSTGPVTSWVDMSGNFHDASQTNLLFTPVLWTTFGINAVETRYSFSDPRFLNVAAGLSDFDRGMTFYAVTYPQTTSGTDNVLFNASNGASNNITVRNLPSTARARSSIGGNTLTTSNGALVLNKFQIYEVTQDNVGTGKIFVDGIEKKSGSQGNTTNVTRLTNKFGANSNASSDEFYTGHTAEVILYNRLLSGEERAAVTGYLKSKYQLRSNVDSPLVSPDGGTFSAPLQVAIDGPPGALVKYTLDGTDPVTSGKTYEKPLPILWTKTIKAVALFHGVHSSTVTKTYTLDSVKWPAPNASDTTPLELQLQSPNPAIPQ